MTKRRKSRRDWFGEFLQGIREAADQVDADEEGDSYDFFRYAPGPPFRRGAHPKHTGAIWRFVMRRGRR